MENFIKKDETFFAFKYLNIKIPKLLFFLPYFEPFLKHSKSISIILTTFRYFGLQIQHCFKCFREDNISKIDRKIIKHFICHSVLQQMLKQNKNKRFSGRFHLSKKNFFSFPAREWWVQNFFHFVRSSFVNDPFR